MNPSISAYPALYRSELNQFSQDIKKQQKDRAERKLIAKGITPLGIGFNAISILVAVGLFGLNAVAIV